MELRHIRYFLAVAEEANFTRAAARLGIGQPPLSQQIKDLETGLGTRLFRRLPQGAELTEAGRAFHRAVAALPEQFAGAALAAQRAGRGEAGELRLGFTGSATFNPIVPGLIRAFRAAYPDVTLTLEEATTSGLVARLENGGLDAAILRAGTPGSEALETRLLIEEGMIAALPERHAAAAVPGDTIALAALAHDPFLLVPAAVGPTIFAATMAAAREAGFEPILGQSAPQLGSVLALVAAELGVALVPESMRAVRLPGVVFRRLEDVHPRCRLAVACRPHETSPAVRNLLIEARRLIGARQPA